MKPLIACLIALVLAGCDTGPSRQQFLAALVGHRESDALRTLGAPNRMIEANGHKFLAFDDQHVGYVPSPYFGEFGGFGYFGPVSYPVLRGCEMTLEIVDGRVASYTLRGNSC